MFIEKVCIEKDCKNRRLLEKECFIVKNAIREYKSFKLNDPQVKQRLASKIKKIADKYKRYKPIIHPVDCKNIEKGIIECCVKFETLN